MSELVERVKDLESNDEVHSYTSEIVNSFETAEGWNPSTPENYDHMIDEVEENLENLLNEEGQYGYQVILSYDNDKEDTDAALNLQFPDVRNDKMLTGTLNYRVKPALTGFQDEISRVNRKAASEAVPEDSFYLSHIPEDLSEEEIVDTDIVYISAPAFDLKPGKLSKDLETLGRTVDKLDQFYEEEMESVLKKSAIDFVSDEPAPSDKGIFMR
ncbi:MAG: hypothetical protein BRC27_01990 [Nanohaloarchaea archaeon SW_10_44_10]|nr:MAG: hypothetical protein BRC27_01990 [Nanohaloarchaea archaeon SW_10_44_10]